MKRVLAVGMGVLVALVATLPLLRSSEREELDAEARSRAPGAFVELSHGLVHYQVEGPEEGQPVLLVHGFSIPSYTWDRMAPVVAADGYRVIRFDLYGRGYSARPDVNYDRQLFVGQIDELLDALQVDRPIDIVGLSMGGPVVAAWASDHPDRVRRVVLLAPFNTPIDVGPVAVPILGEYLSAVFWLPSLPEGALDDFVEPRRFPDWADSFREQMRYEGFGRALLSTVRSFMQTDPISDFEALGRQSTPVLLIWGDQDRAVPFEQTGRVRSALGDAGFTPLTGAGHALHYEQAGRVNQKLLEFLSGP